MHFQAQEYFSNKLGGKIWILNQSLKSYLYFTLQISIFSRYFFKYKWKFTINHSENKYYWADTYKRVKKILMTIKKEKTSFVSLAQVSRKLFGKWPKSYSCLINTIFFLILVFFALKGLERNPKIIKSCHWK